MESAVAHIVYEELLVDEQPNLSVAPKLDKTAENSDSPLVAFYKYAAPLFKRFTGKNLQLLLPDPESIDDPEVSTHQTLQDYANLDLPANFLLECENVHEAVAVARGLEMQVVIIGSLTSATENFGPKGVQYNNDKIIAIRPKASTEDQLTDQEPNPSVLNSDQIKVLHHEDGAITIRTGAGVIPDHLNEFIRYNLGLQYYVRSSEIFR